MFAPFTVQALERPGSHVLFSSTDFPGAIPDHLVATAEAADEHPEALQKLVDAWYPTLDWIEANPDEATAIMAEKAERLAEEYEAFAEGTTLFSAEQALTPSPTAPATRRRCRRWPAASTRSSSSPG